MKSADSLNIGTILLPLVFISSCGSQQTIDQMPDQKLNEAVPLGVINSKNILEGLEVDLRIAKAINGLNS